MKNEAEKAMWSCKTSDTPWTFSSLLKKAVCAILPDPTPAQDKEASKNVFELFSSEKDTDYSVPMRPFALYDPYKSHEDNAIGVDKLV
ncbi:TPA: hypothetical protein IRA74_002859 [Escherichia coli]|nr:hypothetical protein [Escherichia coli]